MNVPALKIVSITCVKKPEIIAAAFYLMLTVAFAGAARAQATGGSIGGTVTREAGGTMPGVRISVSDQARTVDG